jgi:hypothetical protein
MKKIIALCCVFALAFALGETETQGQAGLESSYIFPGVTRDTDIVIGNINPQSVSVAVAFYRTGGDVISTSFLLEPGRQTRLNSTSAGVTDFSGSVVIASGLPLTVSASLFSGDTPFDFILPSESATSLVIPFAPLDNASMDLNVFNPGTEQAQVRVIPIKSDGTQDSATTATIDAKHSTTVNLAATAGVTHIIIRSSGWFRGDRPVAANAFIRDYGPSAVGAVRRTDFAVLPALPLSPAPASTTIPFFVQGEDFFSIVEIVNLTDGEQTFTVTARHSNGSVISGSRNPATIEDVRGFGSTRQSFADMFGVSVTELTEGIITVEGSGALVAAVAIGHVSKPSIAVIGSNDRALTTFAYQIRRTGREFFTGLALLNTNDRDANVTISFFADDGRTISAVSIVVPRAQLVSGTLAEIFPEAQGNGYLLLRSDVPMFSTGLDGRSDGSAMASRRPLYASADFVAPPLQGLLAVGTVFDEDIGVPNVAIRLSGPAEATTLTDDAGVFVFRDIPAGTYRLTPIPIGYTVTPVERTFTITNANSRNNDFAVGLTVPTVKTVTPDGVVVNSDSMTITVDGSNFIPGNVVLFEVTELPTTYVSDTRLTAVVDRSLLTASGDVAIAVRNRGPSGNYVDAAPVTFTVGNAPPTLASVTGQPNPLIAGTVTSPFTITVTGSGFTPATQVQVDRVGRATTFVSQTEVRATILPSDVATPRLVPITVRNPGAVSSTAFLLAVLYPVPRVTEIAPSVLTAQVALDAQAVRIAVHGAGFVQDSTDASITSLILVDSIPVDTEFVSSTQLVGIVPANLLATAGVKQVAVRNPAPALGTSDAIPLFVSNPVPVITSVRAGPVTYQPSQPGETLWLNVVINGTEFSADSVAWVSLPCDTLGFRRAQTTQRTSSTQVIATIPIRCAGTYSLQIRTPQPGGGSSNTATLSVAGASQATPSFLGTPR